MVNNTAVKQAFISQVGLANVSSAISTDDEKCYFKQYTEGGASFVIIYLILFSLDI